MTNVSGQYAAEVREIRISANGLEFAALTAGQPGRLILCLHGFPDNAWSFSAQFGPLVEAGYHVVAPFQRGYYPTLVPADGCFGIGDLGDDALAIIRALGYERSVIFGHDWGALAGYAAAVKAPEKVERLITAAVPYGPSVTEALLCDFEQQRRSWYMFFFLTPFAEVAVAQNDFRFIELLWRMWSPLWPIPLDHLERVKQTFRQPGVTTAALSYYRQALLPNSLASPPPFGVISVPTLTLFGTHDGCLGSYLFQGMETLFEKKLRKVSVSGAGHFVHLEAPALVNEEILRFLS